MFDASLLQSLRLNIINVEYCRVESWWHYTDVYGPFHRLLVVAGGEGLVCHHDREFRLHEGVLHLVPGFTRSSYQCDSFLEANYVHFACDLEGHFDFFSELPLEYQVDACELDYALFDRLVELNPGMGLREADPEKYDKKLHLRRARNYANEVTPAVFLESKGIMQQFISRFLKPEHVGEPVTEHEDYHRIDKAIRFMRENMDKPMTVKELADMVSFDADHFSRVFTRVVGSGPIEYLHRQRIRRIKLLLLTTDLSLEQIAGRTGFSSAKYLSRIFGKYVGMPPAEYRKAAHYG